MSIAVFIYLYSLTTFLVNALSLTSTSTNVMNILRTANSPDTRELATQWQKCDVPSDPNTNIHLKLCGTIALRQRHRRRPNASRRDELPRLLSNNSSTFNSSAPIQTVTKKTPPNPDTLQAIYNISVLPSTVPMRPNISHVDEFAVPTDSPHPHTSTAINKFVVTTEQTYFDAYSLCSELVLVERRQYLLPGDVVSTSDGIQGCVIQDVPILPIWVMALSVYVLCLLLLVIILWLYR